MGDFDDLASLLGDLDEPWYVTVTVEDEDVRVSTNCATNSHTLKLLAVAMWNLSDDPSWDSDPPPPG